MELLLYSLLPAAYLYYVRVLWRAGRARPDDWRAEGAEMRRTTRPGTRLESRFSRFVTGFHWPAVVPGVTAGVAVEGPRRWGVPYRARRWAADAGSPGGGGAYEGYPSYGNRGSCGN
jgi:hypothetical protein